MICTKASQRYILLGEKGWSFYVKKKPEKWALKAKSYNFTKNVNKVELAHIMSHVFYTYLKKLITSHFVNFL